MKIMKHFEKLMEVVEYIKSQEDDTSKLRWNNAAGDWDLGDIAIASAQYDEAFDGYDVDVASYSIYTGDQEDDFIRTEDAE